jgi:hypothetical protein
MSTGSHPLPGTVISMHGTDRRAMTDGSGPGAAGRRLRGGLGSALAVAAILALLLAGSVTASSGRHVASTQVLAIYQTNYVTEPGNFTVSIQVANPANVQYAYFTFCQLSSPLCYLPVTMTLHGTNWFAGTTKPMYDYHGMTVGVSAGYNITIVYQDNSTFTEPSVPNAFSNLSVSQSVTGEYMFEMTVRPQVFAIGGSVSNRSTGSPIPGAVVRLSPGTNTSTTSSTGAYSFSGLLNGTYTVAVVESGYRNESMVVQLSGRDAVQNIQLTPNTSASTNPGGSNKGGSTFSFGGLPSSLNPWGLIIAVLVVGALVGWFAVRRRRGASPQAPPETSGTGGSPGDVAPK